MVNELMDAVGQSVAILLLDGPVQPFGAHKLAIELLFNLGPRNFFVKKCAKFPHFKPTCKHPLGKLIDGVMPQDSCPCAVKCICKFGYVRMDEQQGSPCIRPEYCDHTYESSDEFDNKYNEA